MDEKLAVQPKFNEGLLFSLTPSLQDCSFFLNKIHQSKWKIVSDIGKNRFRTYYTGNNVLINF